jgi:RHH-type proline utilization regulon transcriptional repressor/proline dehydrogenase/delta 1-pyrroline-5-carboxylate dehydrogenase
MMEMLFGAMDELKAGDPWSLSTDTGPVIDEEARAPSPITSKRRRRENRLLKELEKPNQGTFVAPR